MTEQDQDVLKGRGIRVPDREWDPAMALAGRRGESLTDVIRRALRAYVLEDETAGTGMVDLAKVAILFDQATDKSETERAIGVLVNAEVDLRILRRAMRL